MSMTESTILNGARRQPRGYPAAHQDSRYAAQKQRSDQPEVHVALCHMRDTRYQRKHRSVGDVGANHNRRA